MDLDAVLLLEKTTKTVDLPTGGTAEKVQLGLIYVYDNLIPKSISSGVSPPFPLVPTPANTINPVTGLPDDSRPLVDPLVRLSGVIPQSILAKFNAGTAGWERVTEFVDEGTLGEIAAVIAGRYLIARAVFIARETERFSLTGTALLVNVSARTFQAVPPTIT